MSTSHTSATAPHVYLCTDSGGEHPRTVAAMLKRAGFPAQVTHLFTPVQYRRWRNGTIFARLWLRLLSKLLGPLLLCLRSVFWPRGSVIIVNTNLLFAPLGLCLVGALRGHKVVYLLYDLYPDAFEVLAGRHGPSLLRNALAVLTRQTLRRAAATVYLGDFLQAHIEQRYGRPRLGVVIDVAAPDPELLQTALARQTTRSLPPLRLRYGGQLGHMHCPLLTAAAVVAVATRFGPEVEVNFFASGPGVAQAAPLLREAGIAIVPLAQEVDWKASLLTYDFALAALSPGGATVCFPSKTYGMLAAGLPIIAICPHWSDLAGVIRKYGVGFVVSNSPYDAVVDARGVRHGLPEGPALDLRAADYLQEVLRLRPQEAVNADMTALVSRLLADPLLAHQARANALEAAQTDISMDAMAERWVALVRALDAPR